MTLSLTQDIKFGIADVTAANGIGLSSRRLPNSSDMQIGRLIKQNMIRGFSPIG